MGLNFTDDFDQQEALRYRPGTRVEMKQHPGVVDIIAEYDPMMVPPIWLVNDPKPRYPEELKWLTKPILDIGWLQARRLGKVRARDPQSGNTRVQREASCTNML